MKVTVFPPHELEESVPSTERSQSFPSAEVYFFYPNPLKKAIR